MKDSKFSDNKLNNIASLLRESRILLETDRDKSILNVITAIDRLLELMASKSETTQTLSRPYIPREKLIGENISFLGQTCIYKYVHDDGGVFNAEHVSLLECGKHKDTWIEHGYSPFIKAHITVCVRKNSVHVFSKNRKDVVCIARIFGGYSALNQEEVDYFDNKNLIEKKHEIKRRNTKKANE